MGDRKMFLSLLILPSAALAWQPAPGIPLERQLLRQSLADHFEPGSGGCEFAPNIRECNATEIWCDIGYWDTTETCWMGNYCMPEVLEDGCPGFCHVGCDWETEEWCDMGMDSNNCWFGNYCQDLSSGGCPEGTSLDDYYDSLYDSYGSGECFEPYPRIATALRSIATLVLTGVGAGMATT